MQSYLNLIFESCFQWHLLQAFLDKHTFISILIIGFQGMGEALVIQVHIFQICLLKKNLEGLYWEVRWKFSVSSWVYCWVDPAFDSLFPRRSSHPQPPSCERASLPCQERSVTMGNGRNELSAHAPFSNMLPKTSICHWKKCLTVTNHSDSWGTSRKVSYRRRQCIIDCHCVSAYPFILQYCVSAANK